jgi:hypothetical protein
MNVLADMNAPGVPTGLVIDNLFISAGRDASDRFQCAFPREAIPVNDSLASLLGKAKRLSKLSRKVLRHLLTHHDVQQADYTVFCSRFGELASIEENNRCNVEHEELSPSNFSYSVQNALAGQVSILLGSRRPSTAVSITNFAVRNALLDAQAFLVDQPEAKRVLLVFYDGELPSCFQSEFPESPRDYAVSCEIRRAAPDETGAVAPIEDFSLAPTMGDQIRMLLEHAGPVARQTIYEWE